MNVVALGASGAIGLLVVAVAWLVYERRGGSAVGIEKEKGKVLTFEMKTRSPERCTHASECAPPYQCEDGACKKPCAQCVPHSSVGLGSDACLEHWEGRREELIGMVPKGYFAKDPTSATCENAFPTYTLDYEDKTCEMTIANDCVSKDQS